MKDGEPGVGEGTWSYTGGTGKLKRLTGKGICKSASNKDHYEEDHIEGEWSITGAEKN